MSIVSIDSIHKRFGDNEVLKGVSLEARQGDVVSMIGASGSGKSTFLRCINFLEMPTAGEIEVTGEKVALARAKDGNATDQEFFGHVRLQREGNRPGHPGAGKVRGRP